MTSNEEYLTFTEDDVLTYSEFNKFLMNATTPLTKAKIIAGKLYNRIMINKGNIYLYNGDNVTYTKITHKSDKLLHDYLMMVTRIFLVSSYEHLSDGERELIKTKHASKVGPNCKKLFKSNYCKDYIMDIAHSIVNNEVVFDDVNKYEVHFNNGYMDLYSLEFHPRDPENHFISKYVQRDYRKGDPKIIRAVTQELRKILPKKDEMDYVLSSLGRSLSGDVVKDQTNLFFIGPGSNGKSVIMKLIKISLDMYMIELKNDTFTLGNSKIDKILNEFRHCKFLRYAWINELEDKKINPSLFNSFCEGFLQTTSLYKDGLDNFNHNCKLVFTSNDFPNIRIDGGTTRRIDACTMSSKFVDRPEQVDEANHKYLKDVEFLKIFEENDSYKNAFFDLLCKYCKEWIDEPTKYPVPERFRDLKESIVDLNDVIGNFLRDVTVFTTDERDKIDRDSLYQRFMVDHPKSLITMQQFFNSVTHKDVKYNRQARDSKGNKGCYVCIKFKGDGDSPSDEMDDDEVRFLKNQISAKDDQIREMQAEIDKLRKLFESKPDTEVIYPVPKLNKKTKMVKAIKKVIPPVDDIEEEEPEKKVQFTKEEMQSVINAI